MKDFEEEGQWCDDKLAVCSAPITAKDLWALTSLQQKPKALENEMVRSYNRFLSEHLATELEMVYVTTKFLAEKWPPQCG